ncbi:MAG: helix-turn-helix transcriptional regulator [Patescibacteria group bacterium]
MENYKELKRKILKDEKVKKAYNELGPQFEIIRMVMEKRIKKGITQKELAQMIGTKQSAISRFESGEYNPTILFLDKLVDALGAKIKISVK